jgi:hypothetical protein
MLWPIRFCVLWDRNTDKVIKTQGEKHQQVRQGDEPELVEERSDSLAQVPRPEVNQGRQKHIARNEATIGKLQKSVKQVRQRYQTGMRGMSEKDSEIRRLKIEIDNQRGQLERAKEMAGIEFKTKVIPAQSELSIKLEEQTQNCEFRVGDLIGLRLSNFVQHADVKSGPSEQSFVECIKKIKPQSNTSSEERLIKADNSESIDNTLTHFIISSDPKLRE